ncbi:RecX family transcriptional regulator [Paenibacillus xylaniclasticus]|uniref:RecX family transcriptional regulator n=1 Tax=Paenibacillus xylaniclasticus TaxID=588083 RepID=UPI000FDC188E|nr:MULTISPECIES: RecX family transcriptional regulator [Paenibacillus]GFN31821.1 regulatory protein RecX [Paenibacillus curdlanolyticus]
MNYTITSVELDSKNRKRYLIYVDGRVEPALSIHEDLLIRYRLFKGTELSPEAVADIIRDDNRYRAYALAVYYLGFSPKTSKEIERYLTRKELEEESIAYAIERLKQEKLIDDADYADRFARSRVRAGGKGRLLIKQELTLRGVDRRTADSAVANIDQEAEQSAADRIAEKRWRSISGESSDKYRKITQFLLRRGFPGEVVRRAVKRAMKAAEAELDDDDSVWLDN